MSCLVETLEINDRLQAVIERYKSTTFPTDSSKLVASQRSPEHTTSVNTSDLLTGLLVQPNKSITKNPTENLNPLDELSAIFGKCDEDATTTIQRSMFDSMDLLEPITITASEQNPLPKNIENTSQKCDFSRLKDIDILSEELLKENLKSSERIGSFKKEPERVTLNELKIIGNTIDPIPAPTPGKFDRVGLKTSASIPEGIIKESEQIGDHSTENNSKDTILSEELQPEKSDKITKKETNLAVVHLSDIHVDLDDVNPTHEKVLFDDDIKITLNFTSDRPSTNVSVIVISVTNQSKLPVTSFQFDASVRKPSKVRLLPANGDSMPVNKPFKPPTIITQVMLLLNPTKADVDVTCIVGYKLGDDPDPIKESIVAKNIAYVE